jgi:putative ABC transport system permease protein
VTPMLGRSFVLDDERDDSRPIILSHQFWESEFHSSPDIVGKHITVSDRLATVVGVMPAGFSFPDLSHPPSFWGTFWRASASAASVIGSPQKESVSLAAERTNRAVQVVGRLKPDVSVVQARAEMNAIVDRTKHMNGALGSYPPQVRRPLCENWQRSVRSIWVQ